MSNQPIEPMGAASAASPGGAIIMLLSHNRTPLLLGLIVQFVMMLIPIVLFSLLKFARERQEEKASLDSMPS
jgi:mannitol-specific phosphotransferase system IIBC component